MKKFFGILFFLCCSSLLCAQGSVSIFLEKESYLKIKGETNIISFELTQGGDEIMKGCQSRIVATMRQNNIRLSQSVLRLNVSDFSSDNYFAKRDFLDLINANVYPQFQVHLNNISLNPNNIKASVTQGSSCVYITLMNITKEYCIPITTTFDGERIILSGKKAISIKDFGLEPPTEMLGLIRVNEMIDVSFSFVGRVNDENEAKVLSVLTPRKK